MKFLITGDLQIHPWKQFSFTRKDGMNSRLYNCLQVFDVMLEEARKRNITKLIFNGDIFEENSYIDVETYDATYLKLEKLHSKGMETVINIGNHDVSRQSSVRILHSLRAFRKVASVVEEPTMVWKHVFVVPWDSSSDRIKEEIKSCRATPQTCLVGHFGVQGAKTGPRHIPMRNPIAVSDLRPDKFGLILLSDYHTRQRLGKNVYYLGSPLQHSFGEIHRPCIWAVSLDREGVYRTEKIYTSFPQFRRWDNLSASVSEFRKDTKLWRGDYVKVTSHDGLSEQDIQRVAKENGFYARAQHGVDREELPKFSVGNESDIRRTFRKYVRREIARREKQERLLKLGQRLYTGG